ncbi:CHASE2 domain-containing protein [Chloroflexota bacterium]
MKRLQKKRLYHTLLLAGIGFLFTLVVVLVQPFYNINLWLSDQFYSSEAPSSNIVIAGIDDSTFQAYGRWSEWPRSLHAEAINNLTNAGAMVIGFDIVFADTSSDDDILATAMSSASPVVLAAAGTNRLLSASGITYQDMLLPAVPLEQASSSLGHANVLPDPDGKVRRIPLLVKDTDGQTYPAFVLAVLHSLFRMPLPDEYSIENGKLSLLARDIPVDDSYSLRVNFTSRNEDRPYISYGNIIINDFDASLVKNRTVLIGMTAMGEYDTWAIPNSASKVPGVFIHAEAMDTILRQHFLTQIGIYITAIIMLFLIAFTAFALPHCGIWYWTDIVKGIGIIGGLFVAYLVASSIATNQGYLLNVLYPLLVLVLIGVSNILYMLIMEQSDKRFVKELFGRYVSPQIAKDIVSLADTGKLDFGGEEKEVTVLFADIRNFTQISEQLSPEATVTMLNKYLPAVVDVVLQNGGIINKFGGDNVMAIWNAPQSQSEHAGLAIKSAWEIQQRLTVMNQSEPQLPFIQFGIGINTGTALAGNVGSTGRVEYTVIGDTINLASRICSATPGGEIWIGPDTYRLTRDSVEVEEMESQIFKGKTESIAVYRVLAWHLSITSINE